MYIYIHIPGRRPTKWSSTVCGEKENHIVFPIVAIFYPFSQLCEINISLLSLQTQPNTAPNLFQRGGRIWQVCFPK